MKCKYCKATDLPDHSRFCPWCGKKLADDAVELFGCEALFTSLAHPASRAGEIAGFGHGDHDESGEERFAAFHAPFESGHVFQVAQTEVPDEFPQQPWCGASDHSACDLQ